MAAPPPRTSCAAARAVAVLLGLALLTSPAVAAPAPAGGDRVAPTPGGQTSGDSLYPRVGNRGYDVRHYRVALRYRSGGTITATTTIRALATKPLSSFSLDLEGLTVNRVRVDGQPAAYARRGTKLVVTPRRALHGSFTTSVAYAGRPRAHTDPDGSREGWIATRDGATTLNEPVGAMTWFPGNHTPRDKATFELAVTVPKALEVAGSGELVSRRRTGAVSRWTWRERRPMATYLSMVSIGNYRVHRSRVALGGGRTVPAWSFVDTTLGSFARQRALIGPILRFQERRSGRYPFASTGIVVDDVDVGYALETQNRPVFDVDPGGDVDTATLVHELAHQWYGDSVTPKDWGDIWLNEGFAGYAEWVWDAAHGGPSTAATFRRTLDRAPASLWSPAPAALTDPADLFSDPVYTRGALTLEALRQEVGTRAFAGIWRTWATSHAYGTVTTDDFVALAERVSGRQLDDFFAAWLYVTKRPAGV